MALYECAKKFLDEITDEGIRNLVNLRLHGLTLQKIADATQSTAKAVDEKVGSHWGEAMTLYQVRTLLLGRGGKLEDIEIVEREYVAKVITANFLSRQTFPRLPLCTCLPSPYACWSHERIRRYAEGKKYHVIYVCRHCHTERTAAEFRGLFARMSAYQFLQFVEDQADYESLLLAAAPAVRERVTSEDHFITLEIGLRLKSTRLSLLSEIEPDPEPPHGGEESATVEAINLFRSASRSQRKWISRQNQQWLHLKDKAERPPPGQDDDPAPM